MESRAIGTILSCRIESTDLLTSVDAVTKAMSVAPPHSDFATDLETAILAVLETGPASFERLARHADGAFPTETYHSVQRLVSTGKVRLVGDLYVGDCEMQRRSPKSRITKLVDHDGLPTPHPADYDWRFTQRTARLLARLATLQSRGAPVAIFGAPTVYQVLAGSAAEVVLFERNEEMVWRVPQTTRARAEHADLLGFVDVSAAQYGVVVADPPWYPEYYRGFAQHAAGALQTNGVLLLSVLPRLTRPGAIGERRELVEALLEMGFELSAFHPRKLHYRTPPFECLSLRTEGLECGDWRYADLGVFRLGQARHTSRRLLPLPVKDQAWEAFRLPSRQVRVRRRGFSDTDALRITPLGFGGPVLATVSRRDAIRDRIDVWSDLNEAWEVSRVDLVTAGLRELQRINDPYAAAHAASRPHGLAEVDLECLTAFLKLLHVPAEAQKHDD